VSIGVAFKKCPFFKGGFFKLFFIPKEENMKRFWLVMLSLGLVLAFSASAMAVDVKFSGSFYAAGMYQDKTSFYHNTTSDGPSTAFYYQRLRVQTDFIVSPGLKLVTRFDAMERAWGATRTGASTSSDWASSGSTAENQNIAFDWAYIDYTSPIGLFRVGYQDDGVWGTQFGDSSSPLARITYITQLGPFTGIGYIGKFSENSRTRLNSGSTTADADINMYVLAGVYSFKDGSVGLLGKYTRVAAMRASGFPADTMTGWAVGAAGYKQDIYALVPYAKAKIGPVAVQAELNYAWGTARAWEDGLTGLTDKKISNLAGYVDVLADFGMVYAGVTGAYISGDDPTTSDKIEGGFLTGGTDWNPALIMFNYDRYYWAGRLPGNNGTQNPNATHMANSSAVATGNEGGMYNAWFAQGRVGVRPIAPLDIVASLSYAQADTLPDGTAITLNYNTFGGTHAINKDYGWEVDMTATYKITNNLSYMLGAGYLFAGDYYKGNSNANEVEDNFLIINKLTLTF
jgi:hypothetical protein